MHTEDVIAASTNVERAEYAVSNHSVTRSRALHELRPVTSWTRPTQFGSAVSSQCRHFEHGLAREGRHFSLKYRPHSSLTIECSDALDALDKPLGIMVVDTRLYDILGRPNAAH